LWVERSEKEGKEWDVSTYVNMHVIDVNMDVTDANMHVTAVTCMLYCFCIEGHLQVVFARQASMELMRSGRNCTLVSGRPRQGLF